MSQIVHFSEMLKSIYENSSVPVVLADTDLHVKWANRSAIETYARFRLPDGLISMLSSFSMGYIFLLTQQNKSADVPQNIDIPIPLSLEMISLTPFLNDNGKLEGYVVDFRPTDNKGDAMRPEGNQRLISSFSHQYRAPLTKIFSSLSALSRSLDFEEQPELKSLVNEINQNCYRMFKTSINMTDYMKYLHPNNQLDLTKVNITQFAEELCNAIKVVAGNYAAELVFDIQYSDLNIDCDVRKLSTAILHLVSNSLMFSFEDNCITISMKIVSNNVIFSITDTGYGIPESVLPYVYDAFFSYDHLGRPFAGAGLGLTIAKSIVNLHGGTIAIQSQLDKGTTVSFTIPIKDDKTIKVQSAKKTSDYLLDSFSNVFVLLSDTCKCPTP